MLRRLAGLRIPGRLSCTAPQPSCLPRLLSTWRSMQPQLVHAQTIRAISTCNRFLTDQHATPPDAAVHAHGIKHETEVEREKRTASAVRKKLEDLVASQQQAQQQQQQAQQQVAQIIEWYWISNHRVDVILVLLTLEQESESMIVIIIAVDMILRMPAPFIHLQAVASAPPPVTPASEQDDEKVDSGLIRQQLAEHWFVYHEANARKSSDQEAKRVSEC